MVPDCRTFRREAFGGKTENLATADYKNINIRNKRATLQLRNYRGVNIRGHLVLVGTEIKSYRWARRSITDSYCYFDKGELGIRGCAKSPSTGGGPATIMFRPLRKPPLNRKELNKIQRALQDRGIDRGWACGSFKSGRVGLRKKKKKKKK